MLHFGTTTTSQTGLPPLHRSPLHRRHPLHRPLRFAPLPLVRSSIPRCKTMCFIQSQCKYPTDLLLEILVNTTIHGRDLVAPVVAPLLFGCCAALRLWCGRKLLVIQSAYRLSQLCFYLLIFRKRSMKQASPKGFDKTTIKKKLGAAAGEINRTGN